jgi:hypothetical protein
MADEPNEKPIITCPPLTSTELLACPFCGGMPVEGFHDPGAPYPGGYYYVACENDDCPMSDVLVEEKARTEDADTVKNALRKQWNTRHANR